MKKFILAALSASSIYGYSGGLDLDIYSNTPGHSIEAIKGSNKFLVSPDEFNVVGSYESPESRGDNYGSFLRGYITIPEDGDYQFFLSADDKGELYLAFNGESGSKELVASVNSWTGHREFTKYESQKSSVFRLTAGQKIYTESFMKEGGGGDHLSVAWSKNGASPEIITGDYLTSYFSDVDVFFQEFSGTLLLAEQLYDNSSLNIGVDQGQFSEVMRVNFAEILEASKAVLATDQTDGRAYFTANFKLKKAIEYFDGGIKSVKLLGKSFGAYPYKSNAQSPEQAFDGNSGTYYQYFAADNGFVGIDLGEGNEVALTDIRYLSPINSINKFKGNKFQGSVDGITYVDLHSISDDTPYGWNSIEITDNAAYRYYRYYDVTGSSDWAAIAGLEFYGLVEQQLKMINNEQIALAGQVNNQVINNNSLLSANAGLLAQFISYKVTILPSKGSLALKGVELEVGSIFSQEDINNNLLTYSNPLSRNNDSFMLDVSDSLGGILSEVSVLIKIDSDNDGLSDTDELALGTDINNSDSDNDGLSDSWEDKYGFNPLESESKPYSETINGQSGLTASYVFGSFRELSDFNSRNPSKVERVSAINFSPSSWKENSKSGTNDYVGAIFRGYLFVPVEGNYKFSLNSDDGSQLYIDGISVIDNDGLHAPILKSNTVNLSAGFHKIRCEYFERTGGQICMLQWQGPGRVNEVIPSSFFFSSLDEHNALIESIDRDQDGLTDILEEQEGSDPLNPDTDGDRLLDGEEYHAMYNYKTDIKSIDTDSDTVSDYDEIFVFHSNPLVPDFDGSILDSISIIPAETSTRLGEWQNDGNEVFAKDRRGALEYIVDVTIPGIYKLDLLGTQNTPNVNKPLFDLHLYVDGEFVERFEHSINYGEDKTYSFITPYLSTGNHTIKVFWDNTYRATSLRVKSIELNRPGGPDNNENGYPDWVDTYINNYYSLDSYEASSQISPAQIEGKGRYLYKINTSIEDAIQRGTYSRWFSNVTLDKTSPKEFRIDFEDGLKSVNGAITWTQTNILDEGEVKIPVSSSMLLNAVIDEDLEGSSVITVNDGNTEETFNADSETPVEYKFDTPGTYTIQADYSGSETKSAVLTIHVIGVPNIDSPYVWRGKERAWSWPGLTSDIKLEATAMEFVPEGTSFLLKRHEVLTEVNIVARLGQNGPILKSLPTLGFWLRDAVEGYLTIVETYEDGTDLTNSLAFAHQLPEGMNIKVNTISGVTFLDGSRNITLTKEDFDDLGQWTLELYNSADRNGASCHWYKVYQDGVLVGQQNK